MTLRSELHYVRILHALRPRASALAAGVAMRAQDVGILTLAVSLGMLGTMLVLAASIEVLELLAIIEP